MDEQQPEVPDGYWDRLMEFLARLPMVDEPDDFDIEPAF